VLFFSVLLVGPQTQVLLATRFVFCMGAGMCSPAVSTMAMSVNPRVTGSAAGLYGFTQMAIGAICTSLASIGSNHALAAAGTMVGAGIVGQAGFWLALRGKASS
jgi:DHA1 family bicyclomycin/chloramphenicol resistance-like MFS transporter